MDHPVRTANTSVDVAAAPRGVVAPAMRTVVGVACAAVLVMLAVRPIVSEDLGYHLLYGERFWQAGEIVDQNDFIYTLPAVGDSAGERPEPMAGAWYDPQGGLRFPNANWLTQVIFSGVYLLSGFVGLNLLLMAMILALLAAVYWLMRRLSISPEVALGGRC